MTPHLFLVTPFGKIEFDLKGPKKFSEMYLESFPIEANPLNKDLAANLFPESGKQAFKRAQKLLASLKQKKGIQIHVTHAALVGDFTAALTQKHENSFPGYCAITGVSLKEGQLEVVCERERRHLFKLK